MTIFDIILTVVGSLTGLGIAAGGLGYLIYQFKKSGRDERKAVIDTADDLADYWKKVAEERKLINDNISDGFNKKIDKLTADFNAQIHALTEKVGTLTGQLNAEKAQNERLEKIFQGQNPETKKFMELMTNTAISSQAFMEEWKKEEVQKMEMWTGMIQLLKDIHSFSANTHQILDSRSQSVEIKGEMTTPTPVI